MAEEVQHPCRCARRPRGWRKTAAAKKAKRKGKKNILNGVVHIQSTFNNTIITITDVSGNVISWSSAGRPWLQGQPQVDPVRRAGCRR